MRQHRGRWILHEVGARKIEICAAAFFKTCRERLKIDSAIEVDYLPWMASPQLSKIVMEEMQSKIVSNSSVLDVSKKFLSNINEFLDLAIEKKIVSAIPSIKAYENIQESNPHSFQIFKDALELVQSWDPWQKRVFQSLVTCIVPMCNKNGSIENGAAFSDHHFVGAIFATVDRPAPYPELTLNISFAHELGHQSLMIYQHSGDLFFGNDVMVYSGVRKTERPVIYAFHAAVALSFMIECTKSLLKIQTDTVRIAYLKALLFDYSTNFKLGLEALEAIEKTPLCKNIFEDLKQQLLLE